MSNSENQFQPTVLVIGTGAIGGLYAGKLSQTGARVITLCRSDYDVVKEKGFEVQSKPFGDFSFIPDQVVQNLNEVQEEIDFILVTTKVLPEIDIPTLIQPVVTEKTSIILLQNGVEIEQPIQEAFPNNEVISGLAFVCVTRIAPGKIVHADYGRITLGKYPSGSSENVKKIAQLYQSVGVDCEASDDIVTARWKKLVWNAPFNPLSVISGGKNTAEMLANEQTARMAELVMNEVCDIAKAVGSELLSSIVSANLEATKVMKPYKTSMLLDYEAGRPMEIEAITGSVVSIAKRENVTVPHLEMLYALLKIHAQ
ncbi:MAG: 2-dehydropantoate 2-reductase [bacterium]|jgi:2-dehydropantoate 2-reductase